LKSLDAIERILRKFLGPPGNGYAAGRRRLGSTSKGAGPHRIRGTFPQKPKVSS
jgi:hypothetical protein